MTDSGGRSDAAGAPVEVSKRLSRGDEGAEVFCLAAAGATPLSFFPLAKALAGLSLSVLDLRALLEARPELDTIPEAAKAFVGALLADASAGPWVLVGHSYSGGIAFEMARELEGAGHDVRLCMLDSPFYGMRAEERALASVDYFLPAALARTFFTAASDEAAKLATLTAAAKASIIEELGAAAAQVKDIDGMAATYGRQMMLYQSYQPSGVLAGGIDLLLASESILGGANLSATLQHYRPYVAGPIDVTTVAGGHLTVLKRQNVSSLAAAIRKRCNAMRGGGGDGACAGSTSPLSHGESGGGGTA